VNLAERRPGPCPTNRDRLGGQIDAEKLHRNRYCARMGSTKENIVSGVIGGVTGLATALVVIALHNDMGGIDAGDALQFLGALSGTGLAVAGAVWIEERKRKAQIADVARPVLEALVALERKSRPFFGLAADREEHAEGIDQPMIVLGRMLALSPPRTARVIGLFDKLKFGAAFLTSDTFLELNANAPFDAGPERQCVEEMLEMFDGPLKLLIVEYSRQVDPKSSRAVAHLGEMPDI
jgi:hypothetical protein